MTSQYTQSLLPPRKASSLPSTGLVSGSIESSHSSAMLQKEPQKPVKSRTTSKALPEPRMDRRPPACVKEIRVYDGDEHRVPGSLTRLSRVAPNRVYIQMRNHDFKPLHYTPFFVILRINP